MNASNTVKISPPVVFLLVAFAGCKTLSVHKHSTMNLNRATGSEAEEHRLTYSMSTRMIVVGERQGTREKGDQHAHGSRTHCRALPPQAVFAPWESVSCLPGC